MTEETTPTSGFSDSLRSTSAEVREPAILIKLGMLYGILIGLVVGIGVTCVAGIAAGWL